MSRLHFGLDACCSQLAVVVKTVLGSHFGVDAEVLLWALLFYALGFALPFTLHDPWYSEDASKSHSTKQGCYCWGLSPGAFGQVSACPRFSSSPEHGEAGMELARQPVQCIPGLQ